MVYANKPKTNTGNQYERWLQLEQTVLNSRALALDALSFGNDLCRDLTLKNLSPNYKRPNSQKGAFEDDLSNIINEENELNKLFNDAVYQKKRSGSWNYNKPPPSSNSPRPANYYKSNQYKPKTNFYSRNRSNDPKQGNWTSGDSSNRQRQS
jgi:hypothetical protein